MASRSRHVELSEAADYWRCSTHMVQRDPDRSKPRQAARAMSLVGKTPIVYLGCPYVAGRVQNGKSGLMKVPKYCVVWGHT